MVVLRTWFVRCNICCGRIRVFPSTVCVKSVLTTWTHTVNHVFFFLSALRSAYLAYGRHSDQQDQRAVETFLAGAQSATELEYRERQWQRAHS